MADNAAGDGEAAPADDRDGSESPPPRPEFSAGDPVLVEYGGRMYDAKVKKIEFRDKEWTYFIHYQGWSKTWDEWVAMPRLKKYSRLNLKKTHDLNKSQNSDKKVKGGHATQNQPPSNNNESDRRGACETSVYKVNYTDYEISKELGSLAIQNKLITSGGERGVLRKHGSVAEEKDTEATKKLVKDQFSSTLREQLAVDRKVVTQLHKLIKLPRNPNVYEILERYLDYRAKKHRLSERERGIFKRLCKYFDKILPAELLYEEERQQYEEAIKDNVSPSTVYGAEHLLRLFDRRRTLLKPINEDETLTLMQQNFHDFLKYLETNQHFFLCSYVETDEAQSD